MSKKKSRSWLSALTPGILVAATGVGAGDLLTASLAGSEVGVGILWAAAAGGLLKWALNEGLARWQMGTGTTLLEGWRTHFGDWVQWVFLVYLLVWTIAVGGALVNACGVAGAGLLPLSSAESSKIVWGVLHSLAGLLLVWLGGFRLFQVVMSVCITIMFFTVTATALLVRPDWWAVLRGIGFPWVPAGAATWTIGVLGGVGGTVTLLSYGYWVREKQRRGKDGLRSCRLDLGVGYAMTAFFGMAMIIIGSQVQVEGRGATIANTLAAQLAATPLGELGRWVFLVGFWAAVFTSLLGVWQGVPYLFADFLALWRGHRSDARFENMTRSGPYRFYLILIATLPLPSLWMSVRQIQLSYAVLGAFFMPFLAFTLLVMNNRKNWVGGDYVSGHLINLLLAVTLGFFAYQGASGLLDALLP